MNRLGSLGQQGIPSNITRYFSGKGRVEVPSLMFFSRSSASRAKASAAASLPRAVTTSAMWLNRSKPLMGAGLYLSLIHIWGISAASSAFFR